MDLHFSITVRSEYYCVPLAKRSSFHRKSTHSFEGRHAFVAGTRHSPHARCARSRDGVVATRSLSSVAHRDDEVRAIATARDHDADQVHDDAPDQRPRESEVHLLERLVAPNASHAQCRACFRERTDGDLIRRYSSRMKILLRWVLLAVALLLVSQLYSGVVVASFGSALIAALVLGLLNTLLRPLLVLLTLPVTVLTLGLFLFIINALMFYFAASMLSGFAVAGFGAALIGSLLYSLCGVVIDVAVERVFSRRA